MVAWSDSGKLLERYKNLKCKKACFYGDQNAGMKIPAYLDGIEKMISKSRGSCGKIFYHARSLSSIEPAEGAKYFLK